MILSACLVFIAGPSEAAPSNEELLSTSPRSIRGTRTNGITTNPDYNFTEWVATFDGIGGNPKLVYKCLVSPDLDSARYSYLVAEGYFSIIPNGGGYRPTSLFIDFTRPDEIEGGAWTFSFTHWDAELSSGGSRSGSVSWTWQETAPVTSSQAQGAVISSLKSSISLNRSIAQALKGKKPRRALSLLTRQQNLLNFGLNQSE